MKVCTKCKLPKELKDFAIDKKKKDGHAYVCKQCHSIYMSSYYKRKKDKWNNTGINKKKIVDENKKRLLTFLQSSLCKDCGNSDSRVLEFDHLHSKKNGVPLLVKHGYCWDTIRKEIDKCEIVCCNCHRIRTLERMKSYRNENRRREDGRETG